MTSPTAQEATVMTTEAAVLEAVPVTTPAAERRESWHLMGGAYDLSGCQSVDDVLKRADLDWEVGLHPIHTYFQGEQVPVPGRHAAIREDKGIILGDVGKSFVPVQNRDLAEFGKALRNEADVDWDAGGHFKNSQRSFLSFKVPAGIMVAGQDEVESWVMVTNGHDGGAALRAQVIANRVSCTNQVNSLIRGAKMSYAIRHVGNVDDKVAEARKALGMVDQYMVEFEAIANRLADIDIDVSFFEDFVEELIPVDVEAGVRSVASRQRQRELLRRNWEATTTLDPDLKATGWGALNLVTEVVDHGNLDVRKSKQDKAERRFLSSLEGPGAALRHRAFDLLSAEVEAPGQIREAAKARRLLVAAAASR
jgi:phage/plasmid-like protein (TIGR03299 family)